MGPEPVEAILKHRGFSIAKRAGYSDVMVPLDANPAQIEDVVEETEGVVAHTGFEPVISALRGRCPWPLDECATQGQ